MNTNTYLVFFGDDANTNVPAIKEVLAKYNALESPVGHWFLRANLSQQELGTSLQRAAGTEVAVYIIGIDSRQTVILGAGEETTKVSRLVQTMRAA